MASYEFDKLAAELNAILNNTSGVNSGDQDLSGKEDVGTASGLVTAHEAAHPAPTVRDTRNQVAGNYEPAKGADDNFVTDAEKVKLTNTSGVNSGDQDLSGKEDVGIAQGLITTHETTHPAPTVRDARNQVAGSYESTGTAQGLMDTHETTHPAPTVRDTRNQVAGNYEPAKGADDNFVTDLEKTNLTELTDGSETTLHTHAGGAVDSVNGETGVVVLTTGDLTEDADKKYVTDAEKVIIGNTSGNNTGDQDLSGKEDTGVAQSLLTTHETTHPAPTVRDTRNQVAGSYEPAKGADDNYVTNAEKVVIGNTSGTNTGDQDVVDDTSPQLGGHLSWNAKGFILEGQTVGGSDGDLVYLSGANTWSQTDASAEATSSGMLGIRIDATTVLTNGIYTTTGLTAASMYYVSTTAGGITTTAPSVAGEIVRVIGYALSTTELFLGVDRTFLEVPA